MTATTSLHSNALNFMGFVHNGVDPRTGQYTVSVSLPGLIANALRGPELSLSLGYHPLNGQDSGFGLGWNLRLSQFDPARQIVTLDSGEALKVTRIESGGRMRMSEQKIDSFHLYSLGNDRYRLAYKNGNQEILQVQGAGDKRMALPVRISTATGHGVELRYASFDGYPVLRDILDDSGRYLLRLERSAAQVDIVLHPDAPAAHQARAHFVMELRDSDHKVKRIVLPSDDQAAWRFEYSQVKGVMRMTEVHTPTGAREDIHYRDEGHAFPQQSTLPRLPRVTHHVIRPGAGQADVEVQYRYDPQEHNFLGAGLDMNWNDDGLDNLYRELGEYTYQTTETLMVDGLPQRHIERTFNRFHLLTLEVTAQGNSRQRVATRYPSVRGIPFEQQPNQCQLPEQVETRWELADDSRRLRSETVTSQFDEYGNLLRQQQADGIVETRTWYPADGSQDGCPADPEGFVRCLRNKTVTPAAGPGDAAELRTEYRYLRLPPLQDSGLPDWLAAQSETLVQTGNGAVLQHTRFDYLDTPTQPFLHGRTGRQTRTLNGFDSLIEDTWEQPADQEPPVVQTTQTLSSRFDSARRTTGLQQSLYTGLTLQTLADDVETRYQHDALGRLLEETIAPDSPVQARRRYAYQLCNSPGQQAEQWLTDARGVTTHTLLDGLGRSVLEERDHVHEHDPAQRVVLYEARHDAWNHLREETRHDWPGGQPLVLTRRFDYDDWGQLCCTTEPDGVEYHQDTDPIGTLETPLAGVHSWTRGSGPDAPQSSHHQVWLNLFGKPTLEISLDAQGQEISRQSYTYDGLGRCIESLDPLRHRTGYHYDAWSRLVCTELPDDSAVLRSYAAHSSEELPTRLEVRNTDGSTLSVGEQQFDGLARLTGLTVGKRRESYTYRPGQMQISQRTTGAGTLIDYQYDLRLTPEPTGVSSSAQQAGYRYDPVSARITSVYNEQGEREYEYDANNRLRTERWLDSTQQAWETHYQSSPQERPLKTLGPSLAGQAGPQTLYAYDPAGRLKTLDQDTLRVSFSYDALGRPAHVISHDLATGSVLSTALAYDDQDREVLRTLTLDGQPPHVIEQAWYNDGLLQRRHWQQTAQPLDGQQARESLLDETFEYDVRGRLRKHTCAGSQLPRDALGRAISSQVFSFDTLDNITLRLDTFADASSERARFVYDPDEPCQLTRILYSPARPQASPELRYDLDGNQLNDQYDRPLAYDSLGRLLSVGAAGGQPGGQYRYDGHDQLVSCQQDGSHAAQCFYEDSNLRSLVQDGRQTCLLYNPDSPGQPLGQQQPGDPQQTLLLACDANGNVRGDAGQGEWRHAVYSAWGERHGEPAPRSLAGFNGQWLDTPSGGYLLGNGYRVYNPELMRFHSPDNLSPFGEGGINPYSYCLGNPIALRDPTGHQGIGWSGRLRSNWEDETFSGSGSDSGVMSWVFVALGVIGTAAAVAAAIASFGLLTPVAIGAAEGTAAATAAAIGTTVAGTAATTAATTAAVAGPSVSAVVAFGSLSASAALSAGATLASVIEVATGDRTAGEWGQYLGIGAAVTGVIGGGAFSMAKIAARRAAQLTGQAVKTASTATQPADEVLAGTTRAASAFRNPMAVLRQFEGIRQFPVARLTKPARPLPSGGGRRNWRVGYRKPLRFLALHTSEIVLPPSKVKGPPAPPPKPNYGARN